MKRSKLQRAQVQLSSVQLAKLAAEAEQTGESISEIIRRAIDRYYFVQQIIAAAPALAKIRWTEKGPATR